MPITDVILIELTSDLTGTGKSPTPLGLTATGVTPGTYNFATITVDDKGRISFAESGAASGLSTYMAGEGFWVEGSAGITVTSGAAGEYTINVPDGGFLRKFWRNLDDAGDLDGSGNVTITVSRAQANLNQDRDSADIPTYWLIDSGGTQRNPSDVGVTIQTTTMSGGDTVQAINGISGMGLPVTLNGN